jgi:hypothetical protein
MLVEGIGIDSQGKYHACTIDMSRGQNKPPEW